MAATVASPHSIQISVEAGDLVVITSDGGTPTAQIAFDVAPSGIIPTLAPALENDGMGGPSLSTALTWGMVAPSAGSGTTITITVTNYAGFSDLAATVFGGGSTSSSQLAVQQTKGGVGENASCGPIATAPGGAAVYVASVYNSCGPPTAGPFGQLGVPAGNPYGFWAPADGTTQTFTLGGCVDTGGWLCSVVSLSP
jgi:hypothetical protein